VYDFAAQEVLIPDAICILSFGMQTENRFWVPNRPGAEALLMVVPLLRVPCAAQKINGLTGAFVFSD